MCFHGGMLCSNEYTQHTIFSMKNKNHPKLSQVCTHGIFCLRPKIEFGKRAISVRATKVRLYAVLFSCPIYVSLWQVQNYPGKLSRNYIHMKFCIISNM